MNRDFNKNTAADTATEKQKSLLSETAPQKKKKVNSSPQKVQAGKTAATEKNCQPKKQTNIPPQSVPAENDNAQKTTVQNKDSRKKIPVLIPVLTAAAVLTVGVVASSVAIGLIGADKHEAFIATEQSNANLNAPTGKFIEGIAVQGVDLGGKTMKEAKELLSVEESKLIPSINYTVTCHDKIVYLTEDDFDFEFNTVKVLNEAYEYSEYMRNLLTEKGRTNLKKSEKKDYTITMTFLEDSIPKACKEVAKKVNVEMQNAHVSNIDTSKAKVSGMFSFEEGVVGYDVNVDDLITQISTLKKNEEFTADVIGEMKIVEPKTDLRDLMEHLVLISHYTTYSGNTWAGNMNMTVAFESMNGSIIKPGEVFSFNGKTGNSNLAENGYYSAGVIVSGRSADGIGGGICQAATTIYNAAIRAGMTVVERQPHTWPSTYVPIGIDSAIDYGNIDMKFRNDTDHEVYLICYMDGGVLNAYIYGYQPSDFDEIVVSSWYTGAGGIGFGAVACRNYYKDGKLVKTEDLPDSFYSNGGGTSYSYEEPPANYVYKKVFNKKQIDDTVKKLEDEQKNNPIKEVEKTESDLSSKQEKNSDSDSDTEETSSTATNDIADTTQTAAVSNIATVTDYEDVDYSSYDYEEPETQSEQNQAEDTAPDENQDVLEEFADESFENADNDISEE